MTDFLPSWSELYHEATSRIEALEAENADIRAAVKGSRSLIKALQDENADLRMQLDASCNAEELRQIRAENAALRSLVKSMGNGFNDNDIDAAIDTARNAT